MSKFSVKATAQCDRCGAYMSDSNNDCDECSPLDETRYHFEHMFADEVVVIWAISPLKAWAKLNETQDTVLPYSLYETRMTSLEYHQLGYDVTNPKDLSTSVA